MFGIIIKGFGNGMFKPNISPLIAKQIPQDTQHVATDKKSKSCCYRDDFTKETYLVAGRRVIIGPTETATRICHWFYM